MSHLGLVECVIQDVEALAEVAPEFGLNLMFGQMQYKWYGTIVGDSQAFQEALKKGFKQSDFGKCAHALRTNDPNAYEVGIVPNPDGHGFSLLYDSWGPGRALEQLAGPGLQRLVQAYELQVAERELIAQGFRVTRVEQENGEMQLIGCD